MGFREPGDRAAGIFVWTMIAAFAVVAFVVLKYLPYFSALDFY